MTKIAAALMLGMFLLPFHAYASEANRARTLVAERKSSRDACEEYLLGVWDAVLVHGAMTHAPLFCTAKGPTGDDLLAAFNKWAADNPDKMDLSRAVGAILALKHAYPCGEGGAPG